MDIRDCLSDFLRKFPHFSTKLEYFAEKKTWESTESSQLMSVLWELLVSKAGGLQMSQHFPQLVLNLLHQAAVDVQCGKLFSLEKHEALGVCLATLSTTYPFVLRLALEYFQTHPPIFHRLSLKDSTNRHVKKRQKKRLKVSNDSSMTVTDLVQAAYDFLCLAGSQFRVLWDWTPIIDLLEHNDDDVKWFACMACCALFNLSASQADSFLRMRFKLNKIRELSIRYNKRDVRKNDTFPQLLSLKNVDMVLNDNVANVCGILLPCFNKEKRLNGPMVAVPSTSANLYSLALAVKRGLPVLLQGPIGCGKTAIVEHVAAVTGHSEQPLLLKVQLGDQTDSKMLIGTYQSTEVPGEFVWRPGALLTAVEKGYWILLEDIDYAPMDVISILIPLLETRSLAAPGLGRTIVAGPGFQLFATRRLLGGTSRFHANQLHDGAILEKLFTKITVEPLSISELAELIRTRWPILEPVVVRILEIYLLTCSGEHEMDKDFSIQHNGNIMPADARSISTRDLLKWCQRVADNFSSSFETSAILTFQDAFDCFCGSIASTDAKFVVAEAIAAHLNITKAKAEYFCTKHKPKITCGMNNFTVGRATLPRLQSDSLIVRQSRSTFAFTRQASVLLEQITVAVRNHEPVLLVGETGTGKTATIQYLAEETRRKLVVINMNQHSDSADLLGGFKPIDLRLIVRPLKDEYEQIFCQTFSRAQNATFLGHVTNCFNRRQWAELFQLMSHTQVSAAKRLGNGKEPITKNENLLKRWHKIGEKIEVLQSQIRHSESSLAFTFVEGSLVRALREGHWILLDEVNLASAETLHCLGGLLESSVGSVLLLERGDVNTVKRHPDFRLFACMNPATDVGKRDLPLSLRNRFTEMYMEELDDSSDLSVLVQHYLRNLSVTSEQTKGIVKFYLQVKGESSKTLTDGTGRKPHYSLRTLCRALSYAAENPCQTTPRSLYEAFCMSFLTQLDRTSHPLVKDFIIKHLLAKQNVKGILMRALPEPSGGGEHVNFEGFWVSKGTKEPKTSDSYIMTASVRRNLLDLARVVAAGRHPVLLQGDTSVGKTSLVKWLADASGHQCVRVNNHEHTDLQEYVGSYAADDSGRLVFKEGVLVNAMRQGDWIILDELNLAPTEVLEALNRVLDDNRELFITETQETVKAHPSFCLFATQNPPGHYGGRKVLSRAFRNRFVELHFEEIPSKELETILHQRCALPPSYCSKLVAVMSELQTRRSGSGIFAGKQGFITLRDLFRWAERYRLASKQSAKFYDWDQHLADEGYLLLAGRVRNPAEETIILDVLKKHFKKGVDLRRLFAADPHHASPTTTDIISKMLCERRRLPPGFEHLVWTYSLRRLAVLLGQALRFNEPVLMVGDTGCGKTTLCQLFAALSDLKLRAVNCHMHSEGADFLGGLRPVRNRQNQLKSEFTKAENDDDVDDRLFEWVDGPLVKAMKEGSVFLCDEISLADDSVLERLNSVLEPERTLLLAEKGGHSASDKSSETADDVEVVAKCSFRFLATMNPGGDFGKKELSPALRNRFTEIWCPNSNSRDDLLAIIEHNLVSGIGLCNKEDGTSGIGHAMLDFLDWFGRTSFGSRTAMSVRDVLAWVHFINTCFTMKGHPIDLGAAYLHGASLVVLDSLGSGIASHVTSDNVKVCRDACLGYLLEQLESMTGKTYDGLLGNFNQAVGNLDLDSSRFQVIEGGKRFGLNPFYIETGTNECHSLEGLFSLSASSTAVNALRVLRALQLSKPILLEGSPGVGKTSLVLALAKAAGHDFVRINLSEQTDISDLFGADLPVESGQGGQFAWRDGPFLRALKLGHWVVLDELNLASQSVLEGLNACLDHRAEVYVPELGKTFGLPPGVKRRIFACQNPLYQGGARKGLPRSFLNRFTQVYVEPLSPSDLEFIATAMFPNIPSEIIATMVKFNQQIHLETVIQRSWGTVGGPWEVNLRDIFRWCELIATSQKGEFNWNPSEFIGLIYADRMRTKRDKHKVYELCAEMIPNSEANPVCSTLSISKSCVQIGYAMLPRANESVNSSFTEELSNRNLVVLPTQLGPLRSLMKCIEMKWMAILVGPHACGKTAMVATLAQLAGSPLQILNMNSDMDTTELLGGFEQVNLKRHLTLCSEDVCRLAQHRIQDVLCTHTDVAEVAKLTSLLHEYKKLSITGAEKTQEEVKQFLNKIEKLNEILNNVSCTDHSAVLSVQKKLQRLDSLVKAEGSLNCGGRFEWVDSLLVKALQNGDWLLIDNVNFCSPSVLDRLNALLEPNGVLTISERGVIDGEIPTVEPHPNFRLILTMDPQSGEISRAMRNRGVEIFVHGESEELHFSEGELCTILNNIGLSDLRVQNYLIRIHKEMALQLIGDVLSFSDLFRAAQLTVQHIQEGCSVITSLTKSCSDVYVRCRYLATKKTLAKSILEEILSSVNFNDKSTAMVPCYNHLAVSQCRIFPELATVQQEMALLNALLYLVMNVDVQSTASAEKVWYFEKFNKDFNGTDEARLCSVFATALTIYLLRASTSDCTLRITRLQDTLRHWSNDSTAKEKSKDLLKAFTLLTASINKEVASVFEDFAKNQATAKQTSFSGTEEIRHDPRWNPDLARIVFGSSQAVASYSPSANRFTLLLKETILKVKRGNLSSITKFDEFTTFPRADLVKLFDFIFLAIRERLNDSNWLINDEMVAECESAIYLLHRAHLYCIYLFQKKRLTKDDQLYLRLHLKDIFSILFPVFFGADWEREKLSVYAGLFEVYQEISSFLRKFSIQNVNPHATKLSPVLGSAKPFKGALEANIHCRLNRLWTPDFRQTLLYRNSSVFLANERLLNFYLSDQGFLFRQKICGLLLKGSCGEEDEEILESLERDFKSMTSQSDVDSDGEFSSGETPPVSVYRDEVLPVVEHLAILQEQHSLSLIANKLTIDWDPSVSISLSSTVDLLSICVSATPTHLVAFESFCSQNKDGPSDWFLTKLVDIQWQFYEFCSQSARVAATITGTRGNTYSDTLQQSKCVDYLCRPHLSILIAKILSSRTKDKLDVYASNLELGFCEEKSNQLHRLSDILWTNAAAIGSSRYDPKLNDAVLFWGNFCALAKAICSTSGASDLTIEIQDAQRSQEYATLETIMDRIPQRCSTILSERLRDAWQHIDFNNDVGLSWLHLGWLRVALLSPIFEFDPAEEQKFKLRFYQEEISRLEEEIHVVDSQMFLTLGSTLSVCNPFSVHPRITFAFRRLKELKSLVSHLEGDLPYRPSPSQYESLRKEFLNYWTTVSSKSLDSFNEWKNSSCGRISETISKIRAWLASQTSFLDRISMHYPQYRDLTHSCCLGILQMMHGASHFMHKLEVAASCDEMGIQLSTFQLIVKDKLMFPYGPSRSSGQLAELHQHPSVVISMKMLYDIQTGIIAQDARSVAQMIKSSLLELKNQASVTKTNEFGSGAVFEKCVQLFATVWHAQEERRREKEAEDEKTFELRPREHGEIIDDEKQLEALVKKTFPSYREVFEDLVPSDTLCDSVNQMDECDTAIESEQSQLFSAEDIHSIVVLFKEILTGYGRSRWFSSTIATAQKLPDAASPLLARYPVLAQLIRRNGSLLENSFDSESIGGHLLYVAHLQNMLRTEDPSRIKVRYHFYRDPNVTEVTNGQPTLRRISKRIEELLAEWPDHPTLKQLLKLIDRILSFSVTSPVMKFITGFEMLLGQAQEWEKNAHKGVSLLHHLKEVTDQIILWRKLEIGCWSSCLNSIEDRAFISTSQWWLHLYRSIQVPSGDSSEDLSVLKNILQTFMEKSPLGEFKGRLELVFSLACFFTKETPFTREALELVWNVCEYYRQYIPVVDKFILQMRTPIEKNLKEFIKIARWNDINFWAVKQSVDKSHRTLLKHMHRYEVALRQSMQAVFADQDLMSRSEMDSTVSSRKKLRAVKPRVTAYFLTNNLLTTTSTATVTATSPPFDDLSQLPRLQRKTRKLCKKLIRNGGAFDQKIQIVDEFVGDVISCAHELQALEVNKSLSKEKQISEAKNINLRKRKALADLFKQLTTIGLSYRKGLVGDPPDDQVLSLKPIDVAESLKALNSENTMIVDEFLSESWRDCPRYLHRSLARMALMRSSLQTPTKELGPANIHRCQGYATQLLRLSVHQRIKLAPLLDALSDMRFVCDQFRSIRAEDCISQGELRGAVGHLKSMVTDAYLCLRQFRVLLEACPLQTNSKLQTSSPMLHESARMAISDCKRNDLWWTEAVSTTDTCIESLERLRNTVFRDCPSACLDTGVHTWYDLAKIDGLLSELEAAINSFPLSLLGLDAASQLENPLTSSLVRWRETIMETLERTRTRISSSRVQTSSRPEVDVSAIVRSLVKTVLKAIENLVKLNAKEDRNPVDGQDEDETSIDENGLLVNALHKKLIENVDILKSKLIRDKLMDLYTGMTSCDEEENLVSARQAVCLVEQYLGLARYYLACLVGTHRVTTKMSSVLLGIFIELVRKGFCVPAEYSNDVDGGEQSTKFEDDVAGTGIGEGEGLKDVSDRIENQDQLEEAFQEGTEKKDDDVDSSQKPDLKDEEHGIEMDDDFDGKVHDLDKEDEDDENEEEKSEGDEEELEKQMGDLKDDEDAEKLDEKIWGDDDDEEEENEDDEEGGETRQDEYGEGDGPQEETRIVAKDDNKERGEPNNDDEDDQESPADDDVLEDKKQNKVNTIDEREFDDKPSDLGDKNDEHRLQEPDEMVLPEDLDLDGKEDGADAENEENEDETMKTDDVDENKKDEDPSKEDKDVGDETEDAGDGCQPKDEEVDGLPDGEADVETKVDDEANVYDKNDEETEQDRADDPNIAAPSHDRPTVEREVQESEMNSKDCSADLVDAKAETTQAPGATQEESTINHIPDEDKAGVGLAETETADGHGSSKSSKLQHADRSSNKPPQRMKDKLGKSNDKRSLGSAEESNHKRLRTEDADGSDKDTKDLENEEDNLDNPEPDMEKEKLTSDLYKHIPESEQHYDGQTLDAATENQASKQQQQPVPNREDEEGESLDEDDDVRMRQEDDDDQTDNNKTIPKKKPILGDSNTQNKDETAGGEEERDATKDGGIVIDGEMVATSSAQRGPETTFHTSYDLLAMDEMRTRDVDELRRELEDQLQVWNESKTNSELRIDDRISFSEAQDAWRKYEEVVDRLSRDLCEQLRLILEPSLTAKLKGDYRTGKRLNMRKVIPYVASQFRKDKIWLRRTKPSKREYQILLAMDDSSSMADNHSKQLAFEAMALICNSLALLEAGEIGVASFGETVRVLHPLGDPFSDRAGAELLRQFTFEQQKTRVGMMLDVALATMLESRKRIRGLTSSRDVAQLLVIVSDGRGLFNEGVETVKKAVRRARESNLFTVFVIVDNPANRDSILDIRVPVFKGRGQLPEIKSYMDDFPFPFYILLRDINGLPAILSDALRQWFELVASVERYQ